MLRGGATVTGRYSTSSTLSFCFMASCCFLVIPSLSVESTKLKSLSERKKPLAGRLLAFVLRSSSSRAHFDLPRGGGSSILKTQDNPTSVARNRKCTELTFCASYLYQHTQGRQVISEGIAGFKQRDSVRVQSSSARGSCG